MNVLLAVAFVVTWSSGFIGAKLGAGGADTVTVLMWRFLFVAVVLGAVTVLRRPRLAAGAVLSQAVVGLLSQGGYILPVYYAIQLGVASGTTALVDGIQPLVLAALAGPVLGERMRANQWFALPIGLAGVLIVTGADAGTASEVPGWAYTLPFLGMFSLVAATLIERRSPDEVPALPALAIQCGVSAVLFGVLAAALGVVSPPVVPSFGLALLWLIVLSTVGGYGLYWLVLRRSGLGTVNRLLLLIAPTTAVWGALMYGEPLGGRTLTGLAIALFAVFIGRPRPGRARVRPRGRAVAARVHSRVPPGPRRTPASCTTPAPGPSTGIPG